MLSNNEINMLTKKTERPKYYSLLAQINSYGGKATILAKIETLKQNIESVKNQIKGLTSNNIVLEAERAKLQKEYSSLLLQMKLVKEEAERRQQEQERIKFEEQKRLQEAEILKLQIEKQKFEEAQRLFEEQKLKQTLPQVTAPIVEKEVQSAVLDTTPAQIVREAPILKPDEQPKKSNTGLIVGAAALGIAAYLYTQE
jgi:hypothetical protein